MTDQLESLRRMISDRRQRQADEIVELRVALERVDERVDHLATEVALIEARIRFLSEKISC